METILLKDFWVDHWNLLAYVEVCCVDYRGCLDHKRMRCNEKQHPLLKSSRIPFAWSSGNGTRLSDTDVLTEHDDWHCLDDFEAADLLEILSLMNGVVRLTKLGIDIAHQIRAHKIQGGSFHNFEYKEPEEIS